MLVYFPFNHLMYLVAQQRCITFLHPSDPRQLIHLLFITRYFVGSSFSVLTKGNAETANGRHIRCH